MCCVCVCVSRHGRSNKMRANIKTLKAMEQLMVEGGHIIWIAPSGGRDRKAADGTLKPDKFDPSAVEMMRKFGSKPKVSSRPTVLYSRRTTSHRGASGKTRGDFWGRRKREMMRLSSSRA